MCDSSIPQNQMLVEVKSFYFIPYSFLCSAAW